MNGRARHLRAVTPVSRERSAPSHPYERPAPYEPYGEPPPPYDQPLHYQPYREEEWPQRQRAERAQRSRGQSGQDQQTGFHQSDPARAFGGQVRIATMVHRVNQVARGLAEQAASRARQPAAQVEAEPARQGRVVVFLAGQGGTGSTTLACNVAAAAAHAGQAVCVVDLDLQLGDCLATLDLKPQCPMSRLVAEGQGFDWEMLETMLARHRSGAVVLSQVGCLEELAELFPERFPPLLQRLQQRFDLVVVDGVRDFGDVSIAALDLAQSIVLVTTQDVPAVRGVSRRLHILRRLGYPLERVQLVVNRHRTGDGAVPVPAIVEALGVTPAFLIPDAPDRLQRAMTDGVTLQEVEPEADVARELERMSRSLGGLPAPVAAPKQGLWSRLLARKGGGARTPRTKTRTKGASNEDRRATRR